MTIIERPPAKFGLGLDGAKSRLSPAEGMMLLANNAVNADDETHALGLKPLPRGYASIGALSAELGLRRRILAFSLGK